MTFGQFWHDQAPVLASLVVAWHLPTPSTLGTALRASLTLTKGFPMSQNPIALLGAALKLGQDGIKLYQDFSNHDKAGAVAATLDALPAVSTVTGVPLADLQTIVTEANLGAAWDLEQNLVGILPLIKAALATKAS